VKQLNNRFNLGIRNLFEVSRFGRLNSPAPLPHLQRGNLKNPQASTEAMQKFNRLVNQQSQRAAIHRLAQLMDHTIATNMGLPNMQQLIQQLIQQLVHSNLVVDTQQEAFDYSRLVWSHPSILCLNTGAYSQQGGKESLSGQRVAAAGPSASAPSLFLDERRFNLLREKNELMVRMRKQPALMERLRLLAQKEADLRGVQAGVTDGRRQLAELTALDRECAKAGQSRKTEIDELNHFFEALSRGKRPASEPPSMN